VTVDLNDEIIHLIQMKVANMKHLLEWISEMGLQSVFGSWLEEVKTTAGEDLLKNTFRGPLGRGWKR